MLTQTFIELVLATKQLEATPDGEGADILERVLGLQNQLFQQVATSTPDEFHLFRDMCKLYNILTRAQ